MQGNPSVKTVSNRKLLGTKGIATRGKDVLGAPGLTTSNKDASVRSPGH